AGTQQQTGTQQLEPQPEPQPPQEPQPPLDPPQEPQPPLPQLDRSPPWSPHTSRSPPWSPHTSRSPLCRSWSRSRLAHSSRRAHSSWSRSPHSWSRSPHSWSRSPRSSQSSPWFWWVEGGVGQRSRWRERRGSVWGLRGREPLYTCRGRCDLGTWSLPVCCSMSSSNCCFLT
uniref:Uncharacterized protein n=1 Tax=Capra hircus TaxID=9925 RepID=A0A452EQP9_CAPHI